MSPPPQPIGGVTGAGSQAQSSVTEVAVYHRLHAVALRGRGVAVRRDRLGLGGGCDTRLVATTRAAVIRLTAAFPSSSASPSTATSRWPIRGLVGRRQRPRAPSVNHPPAAPDPAGSRCGPPSSLERSMPTRPPRVPRPSAPPPRAASPGVPSPSPRQLVVRDGGEPPRPKPRLCWQRQWTGLQPAGWGRPGQPVWERPA